MLRAIVLKLRTEVGVDLPRTQGHQAHALFLRLIDAADPELARRLHDPQLRKPFTVSGIEALASRGKQGGHMAAGTQVWLRITLLDDELFGPLMARFLRPGGAPLRLGGALLQVEEVIGTAERHPLAGCSDFGELLARAGRERAADLHFISPTAFSLGQGEGGKRMSVLPEPVLVFHSLLRKWNQFAAPDLALDPAFRRLVEEGCIITGHELRTAMFQFPRHLQVGFMGRCRFALSADAEQLRIFNALADFAQYAGVGYKTTMGMGQVRRVCAGRREA